MNIAGALQGAVVLLWVAVIGLLALAVARSYRRQPIKATSTALLVMVVVAVVITTISNGLVFIQPEERGVVISAVAPNGYRDNALQPGLRWIIPYVEDVRIYPISKRAYTMSIAPLEGQMPGDDSVAARTSDGQEIFLDASVIYSIDPTQIVQLHINWQSRYIDELVRPLSRGVIRDAVSQFGVEEVYSSKRSEMKELIELELERKFIENGLLLDDFVLRNITFSPEYAASVEQKQIAEQQAQQAFFVVAQRKQEAEQARQVAEGLADAVVINAEGEAKARIIQAEAEAEALKVIADALEENPDLLTYQYINRLAPGIQVMLVPNNSPFLLPLPTLEPAASTSVSSPEVSP